MGNQDVDSRAVLASFRNTKAEEDSEMAHWLALHLRFGELHRTHIQLHSCPEVLESILGWALHARRRTSLVSRHFLDFRR